MFFLSKMFDSTLLQSALLTVNLVVLNCHRQAQFLQV